MEEKKRAAADLVSGIILVLLGIYIIIDALGMKVYNTFVDAPGFFPTIVGSIIALLGAILAFIGFRLGGWITLKQLLAPGNIKAVITKESTIRVMILVGIMVIYIWVLLGRIHFIASTSIYLATTFLYLKANRQWWVSLIIAVVTSTVIYYAFKLGFGISMP